MVGTESRPNQSSEVVFYPEPLLTLQHRYMQVEGMAELNPQTINEEKPLQITPKAA